MTILNQQQLQRIPNTILSHILTYLAAAFLLLAGNTMIADAAKAADDADMEFPVRGVVKPSSEATLATNIAAFVTHIGFKEGQRFSKGDLLIAFDCTTQRAELAAARAVEREKQVVLKGARYLHKRNAGSKQDLETAQALADQAAAEVAGIKGVVERCEISAPYDGSVAELSIHEHEISTAGAPLMRIVHTLEPEIELIVPSDWLPSLVMGKKFDFFVDETRRKHVGLIKRTGAVIDAVSQTVKVYASFETPQHDVLPGMSGTAEF